MSCSTGAERRVRSLAVSRSAVRLADRDRDLGRVGHRRVAGCSLHAGRVKSRTLARIFAIALVLLRRPACLDPGGRMTATQVAPLLLNLSVNRGDPEELPDVD